MVTRYVVMSYRTNLSLLNFVFAIFACIACLPVQAAESPTPKFVRVPLFFITDRNLVSDTVASGAEFGPHRKYVGECQHDPYMGTGLLTHAHMSTSCVKVSLLRCVALRWYISQLYC